MSHPGNGPDQNPSGQQPGQPGPFGQPGQPGQPGQYGQPGPYGQPAQPGQPYQPFDQAGQPDQPGQPGQPAGGWVPPQGGATPWGQPEEKGSPAKKVLLAVGGVLVALVAVGLLFSMLGGGEPEVGDCVANLDGEEVETVECEAAEAEARIVGIDEQELNYADFLEQDVCLDFASAVGAIWVGADEAEPGTVYCAEPV
ncbi:hypothetical protein SAMN04515665_11567 [Blastococcus sp. DSM 46786]|uniref:hypothetical protein n=1 Tax=Blastococcus sp. DSM 46786 TaxID=1798227 RepID=UPI0008B27872|nr:hypothetical protein [Blastococcus sp. DSM 46786]SEL60413.1 hypothetical protein SAMN04515665_11567 [Blastococcus sp. DSM 46786]